MKNLPCLLAALGASLFVQSCERSAATDPVARESGPGRLALRVDLGAVGVLARGASIDPGKLVLQFSSPDLPDRFDTIPMVLGGSTFKEYSLEGGRSWTLAATGFDRRDSVIHRGVRTFRVGEDSTTDVKMDLDARYSSALLRFPRVERANRIVVSVDGAGWCDTTLGASPAGGDTVNVRRDYLTASRDGIWHSLALRVSGDRGDKDTVLYALDTSLSVVSGENRAHRLVLRWVGPRIPAKGKASLEITLGAVGQLDLEIGFLDSGSMPGCSEWEDRSGIPWNPKVRYGTLCDARNGRSYRTVDIGSATWMAENLDYAGAAESPIGVCLASFEENCRRFGRLYDWSVAMAGEASSDQPTVKIKGVCPEGWHLPIKEDWDAMAAAIGPANLMDSRILRAVASWRFNDGTDRLGWRALGTGYAIGSAGGPVAVGTVTGFWLSNNPRIEGPWVALLDSSGMRRSVYTPGHMMHVRCLKD